MSDPSRTDLTMVSSSPPPSSSSRCKPIVMTSPEKTCLQLIINRVGEWPFKRKGVKGILAIPIKKVFFWIHHSNPYCFLNHISCVSIKMSFYEPRLDLMGWFYSHFEQSYMEGREDKTLKTQERQIRRGGGGVKDQGLESISLISFTQRK